MPNSPEQTDGPAQLAPGDRRLAELLLSQETMGSVLQKVAELAVQVLAGTSEASVTLLVHGEPSTASWTGLLAFELDEAQYDHGYGPCLAAAVSGDPQLIADMSTETRWPRFTADALRQGASSSLSQPIPLQHELQAALNLYSTAPHAYPEAAAAFVRDLAGSAAVAIHNMHSYDVALRNATTLQAAMESRAAIEQAKGILMGRHHVGSEEAFQMLSAESQNANRKLRDIAAELVASCSPPG